MESDPPRWRFWDFGSTQFVQDTLSGESLCAHGQGAVFTDGPFKFVSYDNKPMLVGLEGGDEHCALHAVDEAMVNVVTIEKDGEFEDHIYKVSQRCGDKPARPLRDLQIEKTCTIWRSPLKAVRLSWPTSRGAARLHCAAIRQSRFGFLSHGLSSTPWGGARCRGCGGGRRGFNAP